MLLVIFFKFPKITPVCLLGSASFSEGMIFGPYLLKVVAGPTLRSAPEQFPLVFLANFEDMLFRVKFFMVVTTGAIGVNQLIIFDFIKLSIKSSS